MALAQCRECGRQVSIQAGACPHCGAPQQPEGMAPAVAASAAGASAFRRAPPPPTRAGATRHQSRESDEAPAQARVTKAAQEAAFRRRLIWGLAGVAIVLFALGLSRTLGSWVVLSPLALLCAVAGGLGLHTAIRGRSLPFFPHTRRAHGLLLAVGAVLVWTAASGLVPQSLEEQKRQTTRQPGTAPPPRWAPTDSSDRAKAAQAICDLLAIAQLRPGGPLTFPPGTGPFDLRPAGSGRYHLSSWMETPSKGRSYYLCEMHEGVAPAYSWDAYGWEVDRFIVCSDC